MGKKIVYLISQLSNSGPVNILYNLLYSFSKEERNECLIITISSERKDSRINDFIDLGLKVKVLNLNSIASLLMFEKTIRPILETHSTTIIHSQCFRSIFLSGLVLSKTYKCVATVQNNPFQDFTYYYGKLKGTLMANIVIFSLRKINSVVCCSFFVKNSISEKLKKTNIKVIYNGVIVEHIKPFKELKKSARKKLNIPKDDKVFIFIGGLIARKNPISLLKTFNNIIRVNDSINLIVLGDGELREECERISEKNKEKICFYGNVSNITPFLLASDYYISSSLSEGMPTVVMNAMSFGIPSVLSTIKPHVEMFSSIDNYDFFFDANDQIDMTNKINSILNCDYNYLSEQVLDGFNKNFTSLIMSQNYTKEYDSL